MRKLIVLFLVALLASSVSATYYADSIEALGYNATFSGLHISSGSTDNYLSTSPTGTGNATLYIGNARILTEGASFNPAGGWFDTGGSVLLEDNADLVGIGNPNPGYQLTISSTSNNPALSIEDDSAAAAAIRIENNGTGGRTWRIISGVTGVGNDKFSIYDETGDTTPFTLEQGGKLSLSGSSSHRLQIERTSNGFAYITMDTNDSTKSAGIHYGTGNELRFGRLADNFGAWEANPFIFDLDTGDLTLSGTVDGYDISTYGPYFIDSAGTSGQVWKSDGSGAGYWAADSDSYPGDQWVNENGDTMTGSLHINIADALFFENDRHAITYNDGSGNFNIRIGHTEQGSGEVVTEAGYPSHMEWSQSSGWWQVNIDGTSRTIGETPSWTHTLEFDRSGVLTIDGNTAATQNWVNANVDTTPDTIADDGTITLGTETTGTYDSDPTDDFLNDYLNGRVLTDANSADNAGVTAHYLSSSAINDPTGTDHSLLTLSYSSLWSTQLAADWRTNNWYVREQNNGAWGGWDQLLTSATGFGGDVSGTYNNLQVADDSHSHTSYLATSGGTLTGDLNMNGNNILAASTINTNTLQDDDDTTLTVNDWLSVTGRINGAEHIMSTGNMYADGTQGFVFGTSTGEGEYIYRSGNDLIFRAGGTDRFTIDGDSGDITINNNDLRWTIASADFAAAPRTTMSPMSIRLWDNYNDGGPTTYGTLLQIYGRSGHEDSQLYFGSDGTIRYRDAFYNENTYSSWRTILDSGTSFGGDVSGTYNNLQVADDSHSHTGYLATSGGTMAGTLNMNGNTITGANAINSQAADIRFFSNRADDTSYEWMGWYSGATRKAILIYDGSWDSCAADSTVCFKAEASNKLHLKSDADTEIEGTNVVVTIG